LSLNSFLEFIKAASRDSWIAMLLCFINIMGMKLPQKKTKEEIPE